MLALAHSTTYLPCTPRHKTRYSILVGSVFPFFDFPTSRPYRELILAKRGFMPDTTTSAKYTRQRRTGRAIHYTLSYLVQGEEHGPDGALILLHDFPAGAFAWE